MNHYHISLSLSLPFLFKNKQKIILYFAQHILFNIFTKKSFNILTTYLISILSQYLMVIGGQIVTGNLDCYRFLRSFRIEI
jgi:hypothetical protein